MAAKKEGTKLPYKKVGPFHLKAQLGEGGMGEVFEAIDPLKHGRVALKVMREGLAHEGRAVERFETEARHLSGLRHEHIAEYVTHGVHRRGREKSPLYYLAMQLLTGCPVEEYVEKYGPRPVEEAIWIVTLAGRGIHYAHECGILHRDIKPSNIFLIHEGDGKINGLKVIDFGIAKVRDEDEDMEKLTRTGAWVGTFAYMSPEQLAAQKDLDDRSDVYALGLVLYYLLTGKHAFEGKSPAVIYGMQQKEISTIPGLDEGLMNIIRKATAFKREDRYEVVAELTADLVLCRPDLFVAPAPSNGGSPAPEVASTIEMQPMIPVMPLFGLPPPVPDQTDIKEDNDKSILRMIIWFAVVVVALVLVCVLLLAWMWRTETDGAPVTRRTLPTSVADAAVAPRSDAAATTADAAMPRPQHRRTPRVRIRLPNGGDTYTLPTLTEWNRLPAQQREQVCRLLDRHGYRQIPPGYCLRTPTPGSYERFGGMGQTSPRPTWIDDILF